MEKGSRIERIAQRFTTRERFTASDPDDKGLRGISNVDSETKSASSEH